MLYMLDTCICVDYLRAKNENLLKKVRSFNPRKIKIPAIVFAELLHGAYHSKRVEENLQDTIDFVADFEIIPSIDLKQMHTVRFSPLWSEKAKLSEIMTCL